MTITSNDAHHRDEGRAYQPPSLSRGHLSFPAGIAMSFDTGEMVGWSRDLSGRNGAAPIAVARPMSIEEIQRLVCWANENAVPLVPVSSPKGPRRRGDTVTSTPAIVIDLSGVDKILNIDGAERIAIVEPGVTFGQFDAALSAHGLRSYKPLLPRAGKSVLTSALEREPITSPYDHWDSMDPLSATEIIFGNGERYRTGGAALPGILEEQLKNGHRQMVSLGPITTEFSRVLQGAQGTLGIVAWASVHCERLPALEASYLVGSASLQPLIDLAYQHCWRRTRGQIFIGNGSQFALMMARNRREFETTVSSLPPWVLFVNLAVPDYFPEERMAYVTADFFNDALALGLEPIQAMHSCDAVELQRRLHTPQELDYKAVPYGSYRDFCFLNTMDNAPNLVAAAEEVLRRDRSNPVCIYLQPTLQGGNCHFDVTVPCNPADQPTEGAIIEAVQTVASKGGFLSRPYAPWGAAAFDRDPSAASVLEKAKGIFDPNRIMNPGHLCFA